MTQASSDRRPLYHHRQTGWPILASAMVPFVCLAGWWWVVPATNRGLPAHLVPMLCGIALVALGFSWLTVVLTETHLVFRFGIGLFRRAIPLAQIRRATVVQSRWYEGWGIHWTTRGMLYNVGGFDAVALELDDGKTLRIGSDDAPRLRQAIERAIADAAARGPTAR